eukprot:NODE_17067_length_963_cov_4.210526.p1 GENE.NODE_17067_length_963_cov_4.210526~~NODE_17067_length_963_cov_4.210526.p1  ORF type:complete len:238 (-),score=73.97 NODE_17067_length_963_cov_4.210526:173-886(-)
MTTAAPAGDQPSFTDRMRAAAAVPSSFAHRAVATIRPQPAAAEPPPPPAAPPSRMERLTARLTGASSRSGEPSAVGVAVREMTPSFLRGEDPQETSCPSLSFQQRLIGCGLCFFFGAGLQVLSFTMLPTIAVTGAGMFAVFYTLGNLIALTGTLFLVGPAAQIRRMVQRDRLVATVVFLLSMVMTLLFAFSKHFLFQSLFILVLAVLQLGALVWYILSYIPYSRSVISRACSFASGG